MEGPSLKERIAGIKELLAEGQKEAAQNAARELAEVPTETLAEAQTVMRLCDEAGLRGAGEIAILRYAQAHREDRAGRLFYLVKRLEDGAKPRFLDLFLEGFQPETVEEYFKLADSFSRNHGSNFAIEIIDQGLEKYPDDFALLRCRIESFNRQKKSPAAQGEIAKLIRLAPPNAKTEFWSFIAGQCAIAGDEGRFREAARKTEAVIEEWEFSARLALIVGYDKFHDKAAIERLMDKAVPERVHAAEVLFEIAERHWLTRFQLRYARQILGFGESHPAMRERCEAVVRRYGSASEEELNRKSLF